EADERDRQHDQEAADADPDHRAIHGGTERPKARDHGASRPVTGWAKRGRRGAGAPRPAVRSLQEQLLVALLQLGMDPLDLGPELVDQGLLDAEVAHDP